MGDIRLIKRQLRTRVRAVRSSIPAERREAYSREIVKRVLSLEHFTRAAVVHVFCSFEYEPDTAGIIQAAFEQKKRVLVPVVDHTEQVELMHCDIRPDTRLAPGVFGIPTPVVPEGHSLERLNDREAAEAAECIIVPVLAFDRRRYRLGYGKGHYDRFLSQATASSIGLGFAECEVAGVPREEHDIALDAIVTQSEILG